MKACAHTKTFTWTLTAPLFIKAPQGDPRKCPWTGNGWSVVCPHKGHYPEISTIWAQNAKWKHLKNSMLSEKTLPWKTNTLYFCLDEMSGKANLQTESRQKVVAWGWDWERRLEVHRNLTGVVVTCCITGWICQKSLNCTGCRRSKACLSVVGRVIIWV